MSLSPDPVSELHIPSTGVSFRVDSSNRRSRIEKNQREKAMKMSGGFWGSCFCW